jgi:hypothetical protein
MESRSEKASLRTVDGGVSDLVSSFLPAHDTSRPAAKTYMGSALSMFIED